MNKHIIINDSSPAVLREAFNTIRTNLSYALNGEKAKIIALTGARKNDGVSTAALNLALSFSQIENNKVLLIDGDMHYSALSLKLNLSDKPGFSDCLGAKERRENCVISMHGIDILPAGRKVSNPANLIDSYYTAEFCDELRKKYDYVFIVFPPVSLLSDGAIFAKFADGFVPVVRHDFTRFSEVKRLVRCLRLAHAKILGFVYNRAPVKKKNQLK